MRKFAQTAVDLIVGDTWPRRRVVIWAVMIFCAAVITYGLGSLAVLGDKDSISEAMAQAWFYGNSIAWAYVFGSVADDMHKRFEQRKQSTPPKTEGGDET